MSQKTYKALTKRFKMTKNGKVLKRRAGQDHFNSRASGNITRKKRTDQQAPLIIKKLLIALTGK